MAEAAGRRLAAVMFCDMVGFTAAMQDNEQAALADRDRYRTVVEDLHDEFGGEIVQYYGDGTLSIFSNTVDAVRCAVSIQQTLNTEPMVPVRIGVHVGDVVVEEHGLLGDAVNVASRVESFGQPGVVLVSDSVHDLVKNQADINLVSLGAFHLDNVARPHGLFAVDTSGLIVPDVGILSGKGHPVEAAALSNLPVQVTSFVGRVQESAELEKLIRGSRLVTVTGAGGCGKSRLTVQVAAELLDEYPDGVWLVELAPLSDGRLVASTVANVLGVREQPDLDTVDILSRFLGEKDLLLVVDNCEHLIEPVADLVAHLLAHTNDLRVVATSREPLHVRGETVYHLPTLTVPSEDDDWDTLTHTDSVRLFAERAAAARPGFRVTHDNGSVVASICRHLDGIPLAVELASSATRMLTPAQVDQRLADRFRLLTDGARDDLDHHRTLEATIDWSYQLLSPQEQTLFARLAVFAGGFTLDAAEHVCADDPDQPSGVFETVLRLSDQSLLEVEESKSSVRYRMLETIHSFAQQRLAEDDRQDEVARRHADHYRQRAVDSYGHLSGPDVIERLDRLDREWPNLRRALQWHHDHGRIQEGQMLAGSLRRLYGLRQHFSEGLEWTRLFVDADPTPSPARARAMVTLNSLLGLSPTGKPRWGKTLELVRRYAPTEELLTALNNAGNYAMRHGDPQAARERFAEALPIARQLASPTMVPLLSNSAYFAFIDGDLTTALSIQEEALHWATQLGGPDFQVGAMMSLGVYRRRAGDLEGATAALGDAQQLGKELGYVYEFDEAAVESRFAAVALDRDDIETAVKHLRRYTAIAEPAIRDSAWWEREPKPLLEWARVAVGYRMYDAAATILGALDTYQQTGLGSLIDPFHRDEIAQTLNAAKTHLDTDSFDQAWAKGRQMTSSEALDYALNLLDDAERSPC